MDERYTNSLIDSTKLYLFKLQYLANNNPITVKAINTYRILNQMYNWGDWYELTNFQKVHIEKLMNCIIMRNSNIILPTITPGSFYSNVNTPQTDYTWQKLVDDPDLVTYETIETPSAISFNVVVLSVNGSGVPITVNKTDLNGNSNGYTTFARTFATGEVVRFTAPSLLPDGNIFERWTVDGIAQTADKLFVDLTLNAEKTIIAEYRLPVPPLGSITVNKTVNANTEVKYGALYNWYAAHNVLNIISNGYRLATQDDYLELAQYVDSTFNPNAPSYSNISNIGGGKLKESLYSHWLLPNTGATNEFNFNCRGIGKRADGIFTAIGEVCNFWLFDSNEPTEARLCSFDNVTSKFYVRYYYAGSGKSEGNAIRGIKETPTAADLLKSDGSTCDPYRGNDNKLYRTVKIGNQVWIADNLNETKFRDGSTIPIVTENSAWAALTTGAMCYYNNDITNAYTSNIDETLFSVTTTRSNLINTYTHKYGALYNWFASTHVSKISSSDDWVVPSVAQAKALADYLGAAGDYTGNTVGGKLKETGTTYWTTPNTGATNEVGFKAKGAGYRNSSTGDFTGINNVLHMAISTAWDISTTWDFGLNYNLERLLITGAPSKTNGFSIRLLKPVTSLTHGQTGTYIGNDGKIYNTICIGTQEWTSDFISETKYRNGDLIPIVTDNTTWIGLSTGAMCYYNNDITNAYTLTSTVDTSILPVSHTGYVSTQNTLVFPNLEVGTYDISELVPSNYTLTSISNNPVVLTPSLLDQEVNIINTQSGVAITAGTVAIFSEFVTDFNTMDSVIFTYTLTRASGSPLTFTATGTTGYPAVFSNIPFDTYTVTRASLVQYPLVSITPSTFILSVTNTNQNVTVVNDREAMTGFGLLYNWLAINDPSGLAPAGTHIPTDDEFTTLTTYLGGLTAAGDKLRVADEWNSNGGTNSSGWSGRPGGFRTSTGTFSSIHTKGYWWTSTVQGTGTAWKRDMGDSYEAVQRNYDNRNTGCSVRFLLDIPGSYTPGDKITDIDGNIYELVQIGTQVWATTNLKTTRYKDGTSLFYTANADRWRDIEVGAICAYNNDTNNI